MHWRFARILAFVFLLLFCAPQACLAVEVFLPDPTGSYSVGTKAIELTDRSRKMLRDSRIKRWVVQAFYPCDGHQSLFPYMPCTLREGKVEGVSVLCRSKPDAEPLRSAQFPGIIFIPGLGTNRQQYTILFEELASHGYIVLSADQPYVSNFVAFPHGEKITMTFRDTCMVPRNRNSRYFFYDEVIEANIKDVQYLLDHLEHLNEQCLGNALSPQSLFLMGHNFGGNVAHTLGFRDDRIKGVIDLDSKASNRAIFGVVGVPPNPQSKPVLFVRGMLETQGGAVSRIKNNFPDSFLWLPNVQDGAFCDEAYLAEQIPTFGLHSCCHAFFLQLFKRGPQFARGAYSLGGRRANNWFTEYRKYVVDWLAKNQGWTPSPSILPSTAPKNAAVEETTSEDINPETVPLTTRTL